MALCLCGNKGGTASLRPFVMKALFYVKIQMWYS